MPTRVERKKLSRLMYIAFCDLRALARDERTEQVKDLAEAFHNIPLLMHTRAFSFTAFRDFLQRYQKKYEGQTQFDYLEEWKKLSIAKP
jgi:hypothetical protein